jgi:hypothetical protein
MIGILCFILCATCAGAASSLEKKPDGKTGGNLSGSPVFLGNCRITITEASVWRDWMPIVEHPGPDGGSPLHARIRIWLDNSAGGLISLSYQSVIADEKGKSYALPLHVLPNFRVLPESLRDSFKSLDEETRKKSLTRYNVVWNGVLKKGESREVEFVSAEGPYIPVGSRVHVEMTIKDQSGNSLVLKSPETSVGKTD